MGKSQPGSALWIGHLLPRIDTWESVSLHNLKKWSWIFFFHFSFPTGQCPSVVEKATLDFACRPNLFPWLDLQTRVVCLQHPWHDIPGEGSLGLGNSCDSSKESSDKNLLSETVGFGALLFSNWLHVPQIYLYTVSGKSVSTTESFQLRLMRPSQKLMHQLLNRKFHLQNGGSKAP